VIEPRTAYPWRVRVETTYALDETGLTQTVHAVNESEDAAPFGTGPHPYLVAGPGALDTWTLTLPAADVLEVTPDRLSPVVLRDVAAYDPDRFDWRASDPRAFWAPSRSITPTRRWSARPTASRRCDSAIPPGRASR
jgi:aldose 1-epimerase